MVIFNEDEPWEWTPRLFVFGYIICISIANHCWLLLLLWCNCGWLLLREVRAPLFDPSPNQHEPKGVSLACGNWSSNSYLGRVHISFQECISMISTPGGFILVYSRIPWRIFLSPTIRRSAPAAVSQGLSRESWFDDEHRDPRHQWRTSQDPTDRNSSPVPSLSYQWGLSTTLEPGESSGAAYKSLVVLLVQDP